MQDASQHQSLLKHFQIVRSYTIQLTENLTTEDFVVQAAPYSSPLKWHMAHTSWFFEEFLLKPYLPNYKTCNEQFNYLFNSYYQSVGVPFSRPDRGVISRPTVMDVTEYRSHIDEHMTMLLSDLDHKELDEILYRTTLGIHHEQQHQELMLTDIKAAFARNPLFPYLSDISHNDCEMTRSSLNWIKHEEGIITIGHQLKGEFCYDNELPVHRQFVEPYAVADRLITCGEYLQFIKEGGYTEHQLWLSDGWDLVQSEGWEAPLYWAKQSDGAWKHYTLHGFEEVDSEQPVTHISYYEADAFARWAGCRLATEFEWENAAAKLPIEGQFCESQIYHPQALQESSPGKLKQIFGTCWEWTASGYLPYPNYKSAEGALGEYNGKFMSNKFVLRGGSCASSQTHIRPTYRNFFTPDTRWQFSGIRLAKGI